MNNISHFEASQIKCFDYINKAFTISDIVNKNTNAVQEPSVFVPIETLPQFLFPPISVHKKNSFNKSRSPQTLLLSSYSTPSMFPNGGLLNYHSQDPTFEESNPCWMQNLAS